MASNGYKDCRYVMVQTVIRILSYTYANYHLGQQTTVGFYVDTAYETH